MVHNGLEGQGSPNAAVVSAGAIFDVNLPLLSVTEQERGPSALHHWLQCHVQSIVETLSIEVSRVHSFLLVETGRASQQQGSAHGDQTRPVATGDQHGAQCAPPNDQMQGTIPLCHHADHDYTYLAEGTALAALTAWREQSCLQIWWLLSGTIMVILNAVSLALNISSMDGYSIDQWRLVHVTSVAVLCGYFGILSGQIYGMCLVRSERLFAVHKRFAAPHCAGSIDLRSKVKVMQSSCVAAGAKKATIMQTSTHWLLCRLVEFWATSCLSFLPSLLFYG